MKLYDAVWAPSPRRVRIYLAEKGLTVERELIDMQAGAQRDAEYLMINPSGTLPALLLDCGTLIDDSVGICRYFEVLQPDPPLFGRDAREAALIEAWIRRIESHGYGAVVMAFRESRPAMAGRPLAGKWPEMAQIPALAERGRAMWQIFADRLDERLRQSEYIAGNGFSFADIAALVAVDFARATKLPDGPERPSLGRWHRVISERPSASA